MIKNINKEKTLECLNTQYQDDPDKLALLRRAIKKKQFFIDNDGCTNIHSDFINKMKELDFKKMSAESMSISMLISYTNYLNYKLGTSYEIRDELIRKLSRMTVDYIKRAISNKNTIKYWKDVEQYLKTK